MAAHNPEDKFRAMMDNLGKPTLRGVRRCPKCGTMNGTRGISCKNKNCDVVFKDREKKRGHSAEAVKIITGSNVQVYSVRLRDRGPDYRGFVQLPFVQDLDGNPADNVDPMVLESAGRCYVDTCSKTSRSGQIACIHIKSAVNCVEEATPLTLKNSVLNSLQVSNEIKQDIWLLATETSGPLVQRVTKSMMVVKCKVSTKFPFGFLHFSFFETVRNRSEPEYKFQCGCRSMKSHPKPVILKDDSQKRCVHFYACICAFASDEKLSEEFSHYICLDHFCPVNLLGTIEDTLASTSDVLTDVTCTEPLEMEVTTIVDDDDNMVLKHDENIEVVIHEDDILTFHSDAKRLKTDELLITGDSLTQENSSDLLQQIDNTDMTTVSEHLVTSSQQQVSIITTVSQPPVSLLKSTVTTQQPVSLIKTAFTASQAQTTKKSTLPKSPPPKTVSTPKKAAVDDLSDLSFLQWLSSVTERVNQTMHYQFDGHPDPLVFHAPQKFFEELQRRISVGSKKKRLPNFTTGFVRKDALPLGTFTKYTWYITSIFHVKQIFDTPEIQLEIMRSFVENQDGTFDLYDQPVVSQEAADVGRTPIRPFELKTYLKVGVTSPEQKEPTPFVIEWIPDILPRSRIGELRIKFEYGHQRNGQVDDRSAESASHMKLQAIHIQPLL